MIQIKPKEIDKLIDKHFKNLIDYINQSNTKYDFDSLNCDLTYIFDKDLEQIIKLTPKEMRKLIKISPIDFPKEIVQLKDLYTVFRDKFAVTLLEDLKLNVCPYCNREYIFKFEDTVKEEARIIASIDHYYDKDNYPFLAVSFFNLIPSCHTCNSKFKHTKNFYEERHLHPYEDDFNKKAKFTHFFTSTENDEEKKYALFSKERISLKLQPIDKDDSPTKKTIATFRLNDVYQEHKDIVLELMQKREIYPDSYIDELAYNYGGLFTNREDLLRLITCGYVNDEDINKRPLSKLTKDISEELGLL